MVFLGAVVGVCRGVDVSGIFGAICFRRSRLVARGVKNKWGLFVC